ncbi:neurogenic locus notch homolog protein 4-like isoform X2 [Corticium candelabrum]|uniref:neurogenic locus notch homolog protein 4-like isoform X2 n=1 Tax=Corticium candelabrum TaxID=121492 RepID=UPI002E2678A4|nr:neurogenic locus notch homolog protein 4-like isoform X2 [Corticium candelabrum]
MTGCFLLASLFSVVAVATSSRRYWYETEHSCSDTVCGARKCTVKQRLCSTMAYFPEEPECESISERRYKDCASFRCENNGTLSWRSRRRSSRSVHSCARRPLCACPPGFTGRCCETLVKDGSCPILPKIGRFPCVQQCSNDLDCNGDHKCCEQYCSKVCVDVKRKDSCAGVDCGPGKDCKVVAFPCVVPPCPESFKCVSRVGKSGVCPIFPNTVTPCKSKFGCRRDEQCSGDKICCKRGCARECVDPLSEETTGCDRVVCLPGTMCRKTDAACRIGKVCKGKYECVLEATGYNDEAVTSSTLSYETFSTSSNEIPWLEQKSDETLQPELDGVDDTTAHEGLY